MTVAEPDSIGRIHREFFFFFKDVRIVSSRSKAFASVGICSQCVGISSHLWALPDVAQPLKTVFLVAEVTACAILSDSNFSSLARIARWGHLLTQPWAIYPVEENGQSPGKLSYFSAGRTFTRGCL